MKNIHPIKDIKYYFHNNKLKFSMIIGLIIIMALGSYLGVTFARFIYSSVKNSIFSRELCEKIIFLREHLFFLLLVDVKRIKY